MDRPRRPSQGQTRRRRLLCAGLALALIAAVGVYLVLTETALSPAKRHGARVVQLTIDSAAVGKDLGVNVVVPAGPTERRGQRQLLLFLHGSGGSDRTFLEDEAFFQALARLGSRAPVLAFPDGGEDGYWHNREEGDWDRYVMAEVIPAVSRRFGVDPDRIAIGGISMGGFGAYDLALHHPGRFCAVGGHSAALWFDGGETAPGAFDDAEDFKRNDVIGTVRADPAAFGQIPVWNDYGTEDPFRASNEGLVEALRAGEADLSTHSWPGRHKTTYWDSHWDAYLRFYTNACAS